MRNFTHIYFLLMQNVVVNDLNSWQVMVLGRKNDEVAEKVAERIIKSIQINY